MNTSVAAPEHILDEIVQYKMQEVAQMRQKLSLAFLQKELTTAPPVRDFLAALQQSPYQPSLIAEVKKASPSRGVIRQDFDPVEIARAYERGGAACLSVLTDEKYFQGSFKYLRAIRAQVGLPLLCKEFIIDPYQIYLARVSGADAVLLIAEILSNKELQAFLRVINHLGMTALVEVHTLSELDRISTLEDLRLVGINNRDLTNFTVDVGITEQILTQRQKILQNSEITVVSESGLYTNKDLSTVAEAGARAVLVGKSLVKQNNVEQAVRTLLIGRE